MIPTVISSFLLISVTMRLISAWLMMDGMSIIMGVWAEVSQSVIGTEVGDAYT